MGEVAGGVSSREAARAGYGVETRVVGSVVVIVADRLAITTAVHVADSVAGSVVAMVSDRTAAGYAKKLLETSHSFGHTPPGMGIKDGLKVAILY